MISTRILKNIERQGSSEVEERMTKRGMVVFLTILLVVAVSMGAPAQDRNLPYVDIEAANAEIASLQADTQERTTQSAELESQNEELLRRDPAGSAVPCRDRPDPGAGRC
jgi:cell division protein FtsB